MDKYEYINNLLDQDNLSLIDLAEYYSNNKALIDSFRDVFEEKYEDDRYVISTIPLVLNPESAEIIQKRYNLETNKSAQLEQYKLPILTALLYNNSFFVHACNWCSYALYQAEKGSNSENILEVTWEDLNIDNQFVYAQAAASNDYVQVYPSSSEIESNLLVYWYEAEKAMQFIYTFDDDYKEKHACVKIECNGLYDLDGNEITTVIIDSDLNDLNEISSKKIVNFTKDFEIVKVYIKR